MSENILYIPGTKMFYNTFRFPATREANCPGFVPGNEANAPTPTPPPPSSPWIAKEKMLHQNIDLVAWNSNILKLLKYWHYISFQLGKLRIGSMFMLIISFLFIFRLLKEPFWLLPSCWGLFLDDSFFRRQHFPSPVLVSIPVFTLICRHGTSGNQIAHLVTFLSFQPPFAFCIACKDTKEFENSKTCYLSINAFQRTLQRRIQNFTNLAGCCQICRLLNYFTSRMFVQRVNIGKFCNIIYLK